MPHFLKLTLHMPFHNIYINVLINFEVFIQIRNKADVFNNFPKYIFNAKLDIILYHQTPVVLNVFFSPFNYIQLNSR